MKRDSVTYRLGTSGERDILSTLDKIKQAGEGSAQGLGRAFDRDLRVAEAAVERVEKRAKALLAMGGGGVQRRIAETTGIASAEFGNTKSAEASMAVFIRQQDELAQARQRLLAQADPLVAAQQRYNAVMTQAVALDRQGALEEGELSRIHAAAKAELDQYAGAMDIANRQSGAFRAGMQQAGFQASDFAVQIAGGTSATRAFALQGPQMVQALALMGSGADDAKGRFGKFAAFLNTGWGAAITVGISILGAFMASMEDSGEASESLTDTLDFQRMSHAELTKAIEAQEAAARKAIEVSAAAEIQARNTADANLQEAITEREKTKAKLEGMLSAGRASAGQGSAPGTVSGIIGYNALSLQSQLDAQDRELDKLRNAFQDKQTVVARSEARAATDPAFAITRKYELAQAILEEQARKERWSQAKTTEALTLLNQKREEERKALEKEEAAKRKATGAGTTDTARGRQASIGEMTALLERLLPGVRITSSLRPGDKGSDHSVGRAIDFVPAGGMGTYTTGQIEAMLEAAGVDIRRSARGRKQIFGPGRAAEKPGDHDDHFHVAWNGSIDADKSFEQAEERRLKAEQELQRQLEQNERSVRALVEAGDPYAAILNKRDDELKEIDRLAALPKEQGGIGSEEADILRGQARGRADQARTDLFNDSFDKAFEETAKKLEARREFLAQLTSDQAAQNRLLDLEFQLIGASNDERERALADLALKEDLLARGIDLNSVEAQAILQGNDALEERLLVLSQQQQHWEEFRRIGENAIDTLFDPDNWNDWGELGKKIIRDLIRELLVLAAINPLKNALFGSGLPVIGSLFGGGPANLLAGTPFGNAIGTEFSGGGWRRVGEFGEELVKLPQGSKVLNASRTRQLDRAGGSGMRAPSIFNFNAPGADAAALARLEQAVRELDRSLERRAIDATTDLNQRTFGAAFAV